MPTSSPFAARRRCRGQAIAEFATALVGLMVLFVGLIQICRLGFANVEAAHKARANAEAQLSQGQPTFPFARDIGGWQNGRDGLAYTADDAVVANANSTTDQFVRQVTVGSLKLADVNPTTLGVNNNFSPLIKDNSLIIAVDLFSGQGSSTVDIDSVLQHLLKLPPSMRVADSAAMPPLTFDNPVPAGGP